MSETSVEPAPGTLAAAMARVEKTEVGLDEYGSATPKTLDQQLHFCKWLVESHIVPAKTVAEAFVILQRGGELGFRGLASFDFLYSVNGRVRITPDGCKAKALASGLLADQREEILGDGDAMEAVVTVLRKGIPSPFVGRFSVADAKKAGLWSKDNWTKYGKRMLLARARGFGYGDAFKDLVGGLQVREKFDLDPDEKLGMEPTQARVVADPPAGPDPLLADEVVAEVTTPATTEPPVDDFVLVPPDEKPKVIAKDCPHKAIPPSRLKPGKTMVCTDCGTELYGDPIEAR